MSFPVYAAVFAGAYHIADHLPMRVFPKILDRTAYKGKGGQTFDEYAGNDLVSKFRLFESTPNECSAKRDLC